MTGLGIGRIKGGRSLVVGYVSAIGLCGVRSPIWGISAKRALWSLNFVCIAVVIVGGGCCAFDGVRSSQWSRSALLRMYVGVSGSPKCLSCVFVMRSARGL